MSDVAPVRAPEPRTLIDIFRVTVAHYPDSSAIADAHGAISYAELFALVAAAAARLAAAGVCRGARVGIHMPSGGRELYAAILAIMTAGAAYVPVDADDPQERADQVFSEAAVAGVVGPGGVFEPSGGGVRIALFDDATGHSATREDEPGPAGTPAPPDPTDEAWIIFTSGSTGVPKGVAVTHRSAAAFVDAEAHLFCCDDPIGPSDRVLAGLSVAFDASCEEMWLAWRYGACLVPAPRALVRSGSDLGPWLVSHGITVVSTVPTLAAMWPADTIDNVRLLIFGGEACPPDLVLRFAEPGREVWNTYGPTEATVVSCAAQLRAKAVAAGEPIRIGLPLAGWELAVVDADGHRVPDGAEGELVIGGVGLARYLDPVKDAEKFAPMPTLGWQRAYRSGDIVRADAAGLVFVGRVDDQVKIGGRRIELGEVEAAVQDLSTVEAAVVVVQHTAAGMPVLVGYVCASDGWDTVAARATLAAKLPASIIPMLVRVEKLPVRTSGKVDREALPWPLPHAGSGDDGGTQLSGTTAWLADQWFAVLGTRPADIDADFFQLGGGSLAAAQLVSRIRTKAPEFMMTDIYDQPRLEQMVAAIEDAAADDDTATSYHQPRPTPPIMQMVQTVASIPLLMLGGARWLTWLLAASWILRHAPGFDLLPQTSGWVVAAGMVLFATPFGRMAITVLAARLLLARLRPGDYPRGGRAHLRLWLAEQVAHQVDPVGLAGAPWVTYYARALGARIGRNVDLHSVPPVTGMLHIGDRAAIEPEVDLAGYWIDGDAVRIGYVEIGAEASIGARSTLAPGTKIGKGAVIAPGSAVFGRVKAAQTWAGSPAVRTGAVASTDVVPPVRRRWVVAYGVSAAICGLLPYLAFAAGGAVLAAFIRGAAEWSAAVAGMMRGLVPAVLVSGVVYAALVVILVRALSIGLRAGNHPIRGRIAWQAWTTERLLDASRTMLFPLYASLLTPVWLRLLGATVGKDVEASTVLLIPALTRVDDGAFLADDTMVGTYEMGRGRMRLGPARIGERAFLGNSGLVPVDHRVPRGGLVAVLSVAPGKAKPGSSWLGSPAVRLRRVVTQAGMDRTYRPRPILRFARGAWEMCRILAVLATCALGVTVMLALAWLSDVTGVWVLALSGVVMLVAGAVAAGVTSAAKWLFVGRIRPGEHPLWSSFVWRSEVADAFTEMLAAPWFARAAVGTPALALWLRTLGAHLGTGVWTESYWLPEPDLVTLGDGATVNRGCVVQTHLFHDRVMSIDTVVLAAGSTVGPHSVVLPAATIAADATVGPASLVMRGETVPVGSRWSGNPIGPWRTVTLRTYQGNEP